MSYKQFDIWGSFVSFFLLIGSLIFGVMLFCWEEGIALLGGVFIFDGVSFYLMLLLVFLSISMSFMVSLVSLLSKCLVGMSLMCSALSFCCMHAVWFWVFYEASILSLLVLLMLESPYSERYMASWYLVGYVVLTSLPMLLCLFFLVIMFGSFKVSLWSSVVEGGTGMLVMLSLLFITKIPLPPFHIWLPIVHAEATSLVSVCLSGYMMKLGILGVIRFCSLMLPSYIFSNEYMLIGLWFSGLFFLAACWELDSKRWLAFMSLGHIFMACLCLSVMVEMGSSMSFLYCMGHGFSAGLMFFFFWLCYELTGSRNWGILKFSLFGNSFICFLFGGGLCTVASMPPTVQFFCEVLVLSEASSVSVLLVGAVLVLFFLGGLIPIILFGSALTRHVSVLVCSGNLGCLLVSSGFLVVWSFIIFLMC